MSRVLPILFNTDMVQAVLREEPYNKTVTRRIVKGFIPGDAIWMPAPFTSENYIFCRGTFTDEYGKYSGKIFRLPYQAGDILYVRETWFKFYGEYIYRASVAQPDLFNGMWHPSIHMPKEAARIWLKVTDVRVERLQDMKLSDFLDEGVVIREESFNDPDNACRQARSAFKNIWDSTIKKSELEMYGWEASPWVWVIEFERCDKPKNI